MNSEHSEGPADNITPGVKNGASESRNASITKICDPVCFLIFWLVAIGGD
jgi:hypothetical protein